MKNVKGDEGFIIDIWNGHITGNTQTPDGGDLKVKVRPVVVKSCGVRQMTLEHTIDGKMSKSFHDPERDIYTTKEEAEEAAKGIYKEWVSNSIPLTENTIANHGECYSQYDWWPKQKKAYEDFIESLDSDQIKLTIAY